MFPWDFVLKKTKGEFVFTHIFMNDPNEKHQKSALGEDIESRRRAEKKVIPHTFITRHHRRLPRKSVKGKVINRQYSGDGCVMISVAPMETTSFSLHSSFHCWN